MRRGSSLADFAEKIGADPAALVAALFHLGEMVTATQSVDAEILRPNESSCASSVLRMRT